MEIIQSLNNVEKCDRNYGLDILRILAMLFITAIHFLGYSNILNAPELLLENRIVLAILNSLTTASVNAFALISGYFMEDFVFSKRKLFNLWNKVFVCGIVLLILGALLKIKCITFSNIINSVLPFSSFHYWYIDLFIILYLGTPLIKRTVSQLSKKQYKYLTVTATIGMTLLMATNPFCSAQDWIGSDHSIILFVLMMLIGDYIRKYGVPFKTVWLWGSMVISITIMSFLSCYKIDFPGGVSLSCY